MNKMFSFLMVLALAIGVSVVKAETRDDGWSMLEADVSSGVVGNTGKCRVKAIYASSSTFSNPTEWFVLLDTAGTHAPTYATFATGNNGVFRSPTMFFPVISTNSNSAAGSDYTNLWKVIDYGDTGITISSAPYIYKSAITSGHANRVWLLLRK